MKREYSKLNLLVVLSMIFIASCTDLEIEETDSIIADSETEFTGIEDPSSFIDNLYEGDLKGIVENQQDLYALNEVTSDEIVLPTRGTDWGDNGVWRKLHEHTWSPLHAYVLNNWNNLNQLVFRATQVIDSRSSATPEQVASAKFVRAYAMFWVMDMYGQAPFRSPDEGPEVDPKVMTRSEAFDFILDDLNTALPNLPENSPGTGNSRASRAAANFLLAKLHLNKHIYLATTSPDAADMTKVVELVDEITTNGYALQNGYFDIFKSDTDSETIFFTTSSVGNRMWNGLHYNQNAEGNGGGGWNGFSTLSEFYDLFEGDPNTNVIGSGQEERRGFVPTDGSNQGIGFGFLIGQQYDKNGSPLSDRPGNPLVFTREFVALSGNNERNGIRTIKYHPDNGAFQGHQIVFRFANAHLMKAEALFRNGSTAEALTIINELRTIRKATPFTAVTEQDILDENGRENYKEFWRRNDLIRFGKYIQPWELKATSGDETKNIFPIPATALLSNPNLTQNPGY